MQEKDLFEQFQEADKNIKRKTRFLLPRIKDCLTITYENIIFLLIGFVISCIIFFSLGVEKGRRDIYRGTNAPNHSLRSGTGQAELKNIAEPTRKIVAPQQEKAKSLRQEYVIQLAAFKTKSSAEEQMKKLKQDGFAAEVKQSGDYYQLYVGGFDKKTGAEKVLSKLRERYKDCYIKRR